VASYGSDKSKILARLRRIEGQTRGLQRMVDEEKYCVDILTQVASVQSALEQVSLLLMESHLRYCVSEAAQEGEGEEKVREMVDVLRHYTHLPRAARREANGESIGEGIFPAPVTHNEEEKSG
jgi:DNA-binding FrmR family transcriptional regulator